MFNTRSDDGRPCHTETRANQRTGFYMTGTSVMKELKFLKNIERKKVWLNSSISEDTFYFNARGIRTHLKLTALANELEHTVTSVHNLPLHMQVVNGGKMQTKSPTKWWSASNAFLHSILFFTWILLWKKLQSVPFSGSNRAHSRINICQSNLFQIIFRLIFNFWLSSILL